MKIAFIPTKNANSHTNWPKYLPRELTHANV